MEKQWNKWHYSCFFDFFQFSITNNSKWRRTGSRDIGLSNVQNEVDAEKYVPGESWNDFQRTNVGNCFFRCSKAKRWESEDEKKFSLASAQTQALSDPSEITRQHFFASLSFKIAVSTGFSAADFLQQHERFICGSAWVSESFSKLVFRVVELPQQPQSIQAHFPYGNKA